MVADLLYFVSFVNEYAWLKKYKPNDPRYLYALSGVLFDETVDGLSLYLVSCILQLNIGYWYFVQNRND